MTLLAESSVMRIIGMLEEAEAEASQVLDDTKRTDDIYMDLLDLRNAIEGALDQANDLQLDLS